MCLAIAAAAVPLAAAALAKPAAALTLTAAAIFVRSKLAGVLINLFKANSAVSGSVRVQTIGKAFGSGSLICTNTGAGMAPRSASGSHCWDNLNDGLYGNSKSWIPRVGGDKAGVVLPAPQTIVGIQLARDLGGESGRYTDRAGGAITVEYSATANSDANPWASSNGWVFAGRISGWAANTRNYYQFSTPVVADGLRITVSNSTTSFDELTCIDELEIYSPGPLWNTGIITDGMVTASSEVVNYGDREGLCMANTSMLCQHCVDSATGKTALGAWPNTWCASSKATIDDGGTEWIQVDFGAPTVATVVAVELQGRYPGKYWGEVRSMGFEVQSSACAQDSTCNAWTAANVAGLATFAGAAKQQSNVKYTRTFDEALTGSKFRIIIKGYRNYPSMGWDLVGFIPPSPPPSFLNLHYDASSSANSYNGRTLGCIPSFDAGDLDTEVKWTKLAWFNEDLLQIDALDTTYATTVSGSDKIGYSAPTIASGYDCAGSGSTRGMGVIDLRGTPYVIAGVSDTPCYQSNSGGTSSTCFQWITNGWNAAVKVTCSNGNQRCVVQCGGFSGGCSPINNILQLEWAPASPSP